jgi:hypothetical protein
LVTTEACGVCLSPAELYSDGLMVAARCVVSGSCEISWLAQHRDHFYEPDGTPIAAALPCGGPDCSVTIRLVATDGEVLPEPVIEGMCAVDREGERWRKQGRQALNTMPLTNPDVPETFDGQRLPGEAAA